MKPQVHLNLNLHYDGNKLSVTVVTLQALQELHTSALQEAHAEWANKYSHLCYKFSLLKIHSAE